MKFERQEGLLKKHLGTAYSSIEAEGIWIAGGAITSVFSDKEINDIDLYFDKEENLLKTFAELTDAGHWTTFVTKKAITLELKKKADGNTCRIQLILCDYYDSPNNIFSSFDFSINMGAFSPKTGEFTLASNFLTSIAERNIKLNIGTKYPVRSLTRIQKYVERGYTFTNYQIVKLGLACSKLNLTSWEEFIDQVGGVYGEVLVDTKDLPEFDLNYAMCNLSTLFVQDKGIAIYDKKRIKEITGLDVGSFSGNSHEFDFIF